MRFVLTSNLRAAHSLPLVGLLMVGVLACTEHDAPAGPGSRDATGIQPDSSHLATDAGSGEAGHPTIPRDGGAAPDASNPGRQLGYGSPCRSNRDCESGLCTASARGFVCTQLCGAGGECPPILDMSMECRLVEAAGADAFSVCTPSTSSVCQPCFNDDHCFGGRCINTQSGQVCGRDCDLGEQCPEGLTCTGVSETGEALEVPQCLPATMACDCDAERAGATRPCVRSDEALGATCFGKEICEPEVGWVGCDARFPASEVCDGEDNDCNGAIDEGLPGTQECLRENPPFGSCAGLALCQGREGWVCLADEASEERCDLADNDCDDSIDEGYRDADGLYTSLEHCGSCGNSCEDRFDLAEAVACRVEDGEARCVITECRRGYHLSGLTSCIPLASDLCRPCANDAQCNLDVGDRCIRYGDGARYCGRSCAPDSPFGEACPGGYICDAELLQCRRAEGSCLCGPQDHFQRACAIPDPNAIGNHCVGTMSCDAGEISSCVPPEDSCNEIDDDCDGVIDNDHRDLESGAYVSDGHCGRCHMDCRLLYGDPAYHARGLCSGLLAVERGEDPSCILSCENGYRNVNGILADGCECEVLDLAHDDPDPQGVDENCDGIDGEVGRGIFVASHGDDANDGSREAPLRHIQAAIDRAEEAGQHVFVAAGVYDESLLLRPGISLFGGYSADFGVRDLAGNETAIFGLPPSPERPATVTGRAIQETTTVLSGFTIAGANNDEVGGNSYAVYLVDCDDSLILRHNVLRAGNGGDGSSGTDGNPGAAADDAGEPGAPQREAFAQACFQGNQRNRSPGGTGAQNVCFGAVGEVMTHGGNGGTADCPIYDESEQAGADGQGPEGNGGAGGYNQMLINVGVGAGGCNNTCFWSFDGICDDGGPGAFFNDCIYGTDCADCGPRPNDLQCGCLIPFTEGATEVGVSGTDGRAGSSGLRGDGCDGGDGLLVNGEWRANPEAGLAGDGGPGDGGGGGGGGGAGSGVQRDPLTICDGDEVLGGGGGGGGAGGCGGSPGSGGSSGGASIAVALVLENGSASLPALTSNQIERGFGGTGGDGGQGAEGGAGTQGGLAEALAENAVRGLLACADPGGRGGDGGHGGSGGGGGGGCGGLSAGVFVDRAAAGAAPNYENQNTFPATGRGGSAGRGGVSIGQSGEDGAEGGYRAVVQ